MAVKSAAISPKMGDIAADFTATEFSSGSRIESGVPVRVKKILRKT
jgi:hypothetical protein